MQNKVAIMGGTFDPVHIGHLIVGEQARVRFSLSRVLFMPAGTPPHKDEEKITDARHRINMVRQAINNNPNLILSKWELNNNNYYSYTVDTLKHFQSREDIDRVYFIVGADSLLDIFNWKDPYYILENAHLIVAGRPGYSISKIIKDIRFDPYKDHIHIINEIKIGISSSLIRRLIRNKSSIKYLVPEGVKEYIESNNLYRSD